MPYVKPDRRRYISPADMSIGDVTYAVTRVLLDWLDLGNESYANYAIAIGILETAKLELYRRRVARYEDTKIAENGDVY